MGKVRIDDFVLTLGFDGSPVKKGLAGVEKSLKSLSGRQVANSHVLLKNERDIVNQKGKSLVATNQIAKKQAEERRLFRAKFALEKEMMRAKANGIKVDIDAQRAIGKRYTDLFRIQQHTDALKRASWIKEQEVLRKNKAEREAQRKFNQSEVQRMRRERHNVFMSREASRLSNLRNRKIDNFFRGFGVGNTPVMGTLSGSAWNLVKAFTTLSIITGSVTALFGGLSKNLSKQIQQDRDWETL